MWTVLLVEDEVFVRESLRTLINWEDEGFRVIGEANNGVEAFELIEELQPDLVMCDILMPEMDGIRLLRKVRERGWNNLFLMLTAHTEFDYVREAIELGASNYILKLSMTVESLEKKLRKIEEELHANATILHTEMEGVFNKCWEEIIVSRNNELEMELSKSFEKYKDNKLFILSTLQQSSTLTEDKMIDLQFIKSEGKMFVQSFSRSGQVTYFCWSKNNLELNQDVLGKLKYKVAYSPVVHFDQLFFTWKNTLSMLGHFWYGVERTPVLTKDSVYKDKESIIPSDLKRRILFMFDQFKTEECQNVMCQIWDYMETNQFSMLKVKEIATWIDQTLVKLANAQYDHAVLIDDSISHDQLKKMMKENVAFYMQARINKEANMTDHPEINKVIIYIMENYNQNITVKLLAEHVSMNENYLSASFKSKTGESIIKYIHRVRVNRAQEYLINEPKMSVADISEAVGFLNDNYFIKIFKRFNKITPSQFRRQNVSKVTG